MYFFNLFINNDKSLKKQFNGVLVTKSTLAVTIGLSISMSISPFDNKKVSGTLIK